LVRSSSSQSKHDARVAQEARELKQLGFEVAADIPGYSKPPTIGGYKPDVYASNASKKIIIEVETPDSVNGARDLNQKAAFERAARRSPNMTFKRKVVK
jgi:hypothetical protein